MTVMEEVGNRIVQSVVSPMNTKQIARSDTLAITGITPDESRPTASKQSSARKAE